MKELYPNKNTYILNSQNKYIKDIPFKNVQRNTPNFKRFKELLVFNKKIA
jgi:hypothetical protein